MEVKTDQGEVLDDCCHVTSASGTLCSGNSPLRGHVITLGYVADWSGTDGAITDCPKLVYKIAK